MLSHAGSNGAAPQPQSQDQERRNSALLSMLKKGPGQAAAPPAAPLYPAVSISHSQGQQPVAAGQQLRSNRQASIIPGFSFVYSN